MNERMIRLHVDGGAEFMFPISACYFVQSDGENPILTVRVIMGAHEIVLKGRYKNPSRSPIDYVHFVLDVSETVVDLKDVKFEKVTF